MESNFSVSYFFATGLPVAFSFKGFCYDAGITTTYLLNIIVGSLSCLIICGNLLVITSIIYFKQLHTPTNFLIVSLAVTDLLVGFLILPFVVIQVYRPLCWLILSFDFYLCSCSVWNLCFISVDRYYAVCQPLSYRTKINARVSAIMILVSWAVSTLTFVGKIINDIVGFYLPATIMSGIYLKILMVAQRQACSIQKTTCQSTKSKSKMERKSTKTLAIVMGVFLISWTPFFICWVLSWTGTIDISLAEIFGIKFLGWSNSILNPFIYGYFYSWFRSAFRMIITGKIFQGDFTHSKLS